MSSPTIIPQQHCQGMQPTAPIMSPAFTSATVKRRAVKMYAFLALIVVAIFLSSCQKKQLTDPVLNTTNSDDVSASAAVNTAPRVNAGVNRAVITPASTTSLAGSGSDAEGPVTFRWKQVKGPSTATISQPTQASTGISNVTLGVYRFVLTVTDNSNVSRSDTTVVSVMERLTWTVSGLAREAIVHRPSGGSGAPPVLMAFHGHGATNINFAENDAYEDSWGEALVVYPLGLRTWAPADLSCRSRGWQRLVGEVNCVTGVKDQDLKFFDAILPTLQSNYNANLSLVFIVGYSNGGEWAYDALWPSRGNKIAALAPSAAALDTPIGTTGKMPKPLMHTAGTKDASVRYRDQLHGVEKVRILNQCSTTGTTWATGPDGLLGTRYASPIHAPVVFLKYEGGHEYPRTVPALIVRFFKEIIAGSSTVTANASPAPEVPVTAYHPNLISPLNSPLLLRQSP